MPTTLRLTQQFQSLAPLLQLHAQCRSFHVCEPRRALGNDPEILSNLPPKLPFPTKPNPSPYEIFHLHSGATQTQIKKRCESMSIGIRAPPRIWMLPTGTLHVTMKLLLILGWMASDLELVRMHHPDSPHTRDIPSSLAQSRFQSIAAAYDLLRNPHLSKPATYRDDDDMYMAEVNRRKAHHARHRGMGVRDWERQQSAMAASVDAGKWSHDRAIVYAFGIFTLGTVISHFATPTASEMVERQHRRTRTHLTEAKERGKGRREEIRKWLEESSESGEAGPYLHGFGDTRGRVAEGGAKNSREIV